MPRATQNNAAVKVGEIFREAGSAFTKLAEMTTLMHPADDSQPGGKWSDEEIEMLRSCVHRFALDLNKLSHHMKNKTVSQIRATLKKKAFEDAGIPLRQAIGAGGGSVGGPGQQVSPLSLETASSLATGLHSPLFASAQGLRGKNSEVTLNMLNATENEVDVEGLSSEGVKLEFETNNDDVPT